MFYSRYHHRQKYSIRVIIVAKNILHIVVVKVFYTQSYLHTIFIVVKILYITHAIIVASIFYTSQSPNYFSRFFVIAKIFTRRHSRQNILHTSSSSPKCSPRVIIVTPIARESVSGWHEFLIQGTVSLCKYWRFPFISSSYFCLLITSLFLCLISTCKYALPAAQLLQS